MKIGVELNIDVTKIDKSKIFAGKKGKYLTMTAFIDIDNKGQYGDNGMITHKKDDGESNGAILGNAKVFWKDEAQPQAPTQPGSNQAPELDSFDDDMPF